MHPHSSCCSLSRFLKIPLLSIQTLADTIAAWIPITWFPVARRSRRWLALFVFRSSALHWWNGCFFSESKQFEKPFISAVWFCQILFTSECSTQHLFDAIFRWGCRSEMGFCDRLGIFRQRQGERSDEVQLEQADAAKTPSIQHLPVLLNEQWLDFKRELSLKCPQDTAKFFALFLFGCIVAAKMHIHAAACQLGGNGAEAPHFVGAYQHVTNASAIFQIFE